MNEHEINLQKKKLSKENKNFNKIDFFSFNMKIA